ncbi:MAG: hypothetical protein JG781_853 [Peptococcaceae bacterium]|jgi:hypothetical protein|nr:hypothetical protein [Peptococcaceae bacterium]
MVNENAQTEMFFGGFGLIWLIFAIIIICVIFRPIFSPYPYGY